MGWLKFFQKKIFYTLPNLNSLLRMVQKNKAQISLNVCPDLCEEVAEM